MYRNIGGNGKLYKINFKCIHNYKKYSKTDHKIYNSPSFDNWVKIFFIF